MKNILVLLLLILASACKTTQQNGTDSLSQMQALRYGDWYYAYLQDTDKMDCDFHQMSREEVQTLIEANHTGDQDNRAPRRLLPFENKYFAKKKPVGETERVETKICMDGVGKVIAVRHGYPYDPKVGDKVTAALMQLSYEATDANGNSCIECKTAFFWLLK